MIQEKYHKQNDVFGMNINNSNKKYKKPKRKTAATTNPQASKKINLDYEHEKNNGRLPRCPLLAKDSEWVNGLQPPLAVSSRTTDNVSDEEEVLQLVECEDGPEMKPLTIMFPGLLEKDRQTLEDMLNKTMSTTEVTKHLLGQKADFSLMKKVNRLIPSEKKWLEAVSEDSNSVSSEMQGRFDGRDESTETNSNTTKLRLNLCASEAHASTSSSKNTLQ